MPPVFFTIIFWETVHWFSTGFLFTPQKIWMNGTKTLNLFTMNKTWFSGQKNLGHVLKLYTLFCSKIIEMLVHFLNVLAIVHLYVPNSCISIRMPVACSCCGFNASWSDEWFPSFSSWHYSRDAFKRCCVYCSWARILWAFKLPQLHRMVISL